MPLTQEQAKQIKKQLFQQIKQQLPAQQQKAAMQQIQAMNTEQLEQFLIQNKMIKQPGQERSAESEEKNIEQTGCIFCNIIENKTKSYKINENKSAIAILDINPLSQGQALIIPKKHETIEKLPSSVLGLAKKVAKKLKSKLKPEDIKIETSNIQGHGIVTILPLYKETKLEKKQAKPEELQELQEKLKTKPRKKRAEKKPRKANELPKAPKRIP